MSARRLWTDQTWCAMSFFGAGLEALLVLRFSVTGETAAFALCVLIPWVWFQLTELFLGPSGGQP